jgi:hypothetical protein
MVAESNIDLLISGSELLEVRRLPGEGEQPSSGSACKRCDRCTVHNHRWQVGSQWRPVSTCVREGGFRDSRLFAYGHD